MTDTPHPFAALLRDVPRYSLIDSPYGPYMGREESGQYLDISHVLAAITLPDDEAELSGLINALRSGEQADMDGIMVRVSRQACEEAADLITRLLALRAADAARIKELEAEQDALISQHAVMMMERDAARYEVSDAEAHIAALTATVERMRGLLATVASSFHQLARERDLSETELDFMNSVDAAITEEPK